MSRVKRGSVFLTIFFIVLILGLFYLISLEAQDNSGKFRTEQLQRSYLGSYGELVKEYGMHSLREAGTRGSFISALNCADAPGCYWLAYGQPTDESAGRAADSIASATRLECNDFLKNIEGLNFGKIIINSSGKIDKVQVWVNESSIEPNENNTAPADESFDISANGRQEAIIESGLSDEQRFVIHAYTMTIYPLRYWYLYRVIKKWIDDGILTTKTCQAEELIQGQGGSRPCDTTGVNDATVEMIVKKSVEKLEERFAKKDPFVTCNYTIPCSYAKTVILCCCGKCPPPRCSPKCLTNITVCNEFPNNCYRWVCPNTCNYLNPTQIGPKCGGGSVYIPNIECISGDCDKSNMNFTGQYQKLDLNMLDAVPLKLNEHRTPNVNPHGNSPVIPHIETCEVAEPPCSKIKVKYKPFEKLSPAEYCNVKCPDKCHGFGENHTIEFVTEIVCTDKKYQQPVLPANFKNLKFRIRAHVYLNHWVDPPPPPRCIKVKCC